MHNDIENESDALPIVLLADLEYCLTFVPSATRNILIFPYPSQPTTSGVVGWEG